MRILNAMPTAMEVTATEVTAAMEVLEKVMGTAALMEGVQQPWLEGQVQRVREEDAFAKHYRRLWRRHSKSLGLDRHEQPIHHTLPVRLLLLLLLL